MVTSPSRRLIAAVLCIFACAGTGLGSRISPRTCSGTIKAKDGDTCASIAQDTGISVSQFLLANPTITSCEGLIAGQEYCISDDEPGSPTTTSPPSSGLEISLDGSCGDGVTCLGSEYGDCCSEHSFCGSTGDYCLAGCQAEFGKCGSSGGGETTPPAETATATATVTSTAVVTATTWTTATSTSTEMVVETTTSTAVADVTSTVITTSTREVTRLVVETTTSTSIVIATSTVVTTATSIIIGDGSATATVTVVSTSVVAGTCSLTRPDTPITSTRPPVTTTQPPMGAPSPTLPETDGDCKLSNSCRPPRNDFELTDPGREFYKVRSGDTCAAVAGGNSISEDQL